MEEEIDRYEKSINDIYKTLEFYQLRNGVFRKSINDIEIETENRKKEIEGVRKKIDQTFNNLIDPFKNSFFFLPSWAGLKHNQKETNLHLQYQRDRTEILLGINTTIGFFSNNFSNAQKKAKEVFLLLDSKQNLYANPRFSLDRWKAFILNVESVSRIIQFMEETHNYEEYKTIFSVLETSKSLDSDNLFTHLLEIDALNCSEEEKNLILSKNKLTKIIEDTSKSKNPFIMAVIKNFEGVNYKKENN